MLAWHSDRASARSGPVRWWGPRGAARHVDRYGEVSPWRTTNAAWRSSGPSSRTTSRPTTRWAARPSPSGTTSASPRPPSATTWRCWRSRATLRSPTPAPGGGPRPRATGPSSTGFGRSSRCCRLRAPAATTRSDVAVREEQGYITQPHTSAGRVPTDKAYRLFVDRLSAVKPLSAADRRAIERSLDGAVDLHDVLNRSVRLLAQLTRQVAVVQYPTLSRSAVRHLEVVHLAAARLMLVLITDTGRVEQRIVDTPVDVDAEAVAELRSLLNSAFGGVKLVDAGNKGPELLGTGPPHLQGVVEIGRGSWRERV